MKEVTEWCGYPGHSRNCTGHIDEEGFFICEYGHRTKSVILSGSNAEALQNFYNNLDSIDDDDVQILGKRLSNELRE